MTPASDGQEGSPTDLSKEEKGRDEKSVLGEAIMQARPFSSQSFPDSAISGRRDKPETASSTEQDQSSTGQFCHLAKRKTTGPVTALQFKKIPCYHYEKDFLSKAVRP